ncbi:uncharacterized protein LOC141607250 [Silene latifolia]|uniref:uncharacterized protein LOC141607250 n=1 Tax=Silene latifolia TaxID=37657 RepID=UPI003D782829
MELMLMEIDYPSILQSLNIMKDTTGFINDSGTPYTLLARSSYNPLREAIVKFFVETYGSQPSPPRQVIDLCYALNPGYAQNVFPIVTQLFLNNEQVGEIDMVLSKERLFVDVKEIIGIDQGFCIMVKPIDDPDQSIFGSFQQVSFGILYEVRNSRLSFIPVDTSLSHLPSTT